jgi:hypothetical protein
MVAKGNVDKHRYSREGVGRVVEQQKWGRAKAEERYGPLQYRDGAPRPPDKHAPQAPENKQGPGYSNIHRNDWIRGAGESGEVKPNFDHRGNPNFERRSSFERRSGFEFRGKK